MACWHCRAGLAKPVTAQKQARQRIPPLCCSRPCPSRPAELIKLARFAPGARALLRIRADDPGARCQLGNKYGAEVRSRLRNAWEC